MQIKDDTNISAYRTLAYLGALWMRDVTWSIQSSVMDISLLDVFPHQHTAVYDRMLPQSPKLRFLLADEPGTGKTIMTGMWLVEALRLNKVGNGRVLIIVPAGLVSKWVDDMQRFFGLEFHILNRHTKLDIPTHRLWVSSLHLLGANTEVSALASNNWDAVVFDEAHNLTTTASTFRAVAEQMCNNTPQVLLLTATPHRGDKKQWRKLLDLLSGDISDTPGEEHFLRRLKEQIVDTNGDPVFKARKAVNHRLHLDHDELEIYNETQQMVAQFGEPEAKHLLQMVYGKRAASSLYSLSCTLQRRFNHLSVAKPDYGMFGDDETEEDKRATEIASLNTSAEQLAIRDLLCKIERLGTQYASKLPKLRELLGSPGSSQAVIFSEYRSTVEWLADILKDDGWRIALYHGELSSDEKDQMREDFKTGKKDLFISTDAGGEGIDLQTASVLVNYDIPWSLVKLEQRMGRIHRIGQHNVCYLHNLITVGTREHDAFATLLDKITEAANQLDGAIFDCLDAVIERVHEAGIRKILTNAWLGSSSQSNSCIVTPEVDDLVTAYKEHRSNQPQAGSISNTFNNIKAKHSKNAVNPGCLDWWLTICNQAGLFNVERSPAGEGVWHIESKAAVWPGHPTITTRIEHQTADRHLLTPASSVLREAAEVVIESFNPYDTTNAFVGNEYQQDYNLHAYTDGELAVLVRTRPDGSQAMILDMDALMALHPGGAVSGVAHNPHDSYDLAEITLAEKTEELAEASETIHAMKVKNALHSYLEIQTSENVTVKQKRYNYYKNLKSSATHPSSSVVSHALSVVVGKDTKEVEPSETVAVRVVREHYRNLGWQVKDVSTLKYGYDLEVNKDGETQYLEVKGIKGNKGDIRFTPQELKSAITRGDLYRLIVVENCGSDNPNMLPSLAAPGTTIAEGLRGETIRVGLGTIRKAVNTLSEVSTAAA